MMHSLTTAMTRFQSIPSPFRFAVERRRVRGTPLDPAEFGAENWRILRERVWTSRVSVESSTDPQDAPRSATATRQFGTAAESLEGLWTHIIPLPSRAEAEALSITLLHRVRPNPHSAIRNAMNVASKGLTSRAHPV